ncbi:MAG: hypothetical protein ONB31_13855 [candidate division KSB1 bacterium]|nr:hypothetical protein [candidate division KSB1 bacterium]MDZ7336662.1 hypothetical protein [candidate division KSB1 bacterium]MDZ7359011.1 hypothetical protein [candidate division KSB1 bacterium]MDZ7402313.1 hypothetical protein [candidate division KSB1 bacterium]
MLEIKERGAGDRFQVMNGNSPGGITGLKAMLRTPFLISSEYCGGSELGRGDSLTRNWELQTEDTSPTSLIK